MKAEAMPDRLENRQCAAVEQLHPVWAGAQDCRPAHAALHDRLEVEEAKHVSKSSSLASLLALVSISNLFVVATCGAFLFVYKAI